MIPNKLYIPTTTLNFNNIMASESISPAGFYSVRNFGYKRFDKVEPNNLDKRIILYDKYPIYDIVDIELENHPLVIEVSSQHMGEVIINKHKNGIFYTEETIYLNPFSTKIYFRNENEKRRTLSKVEQSLNTKMVSIYQNCIRIKPSDIISFEWRNNDLTDSTKDNSNHISKDRKLNKLKGFLYAYLFGTNRSLSSEVVKLKKYAKELQNTLSAIITNPEGYANNKQKEEIDILYHKINDAFYLVEGIDKILQNHIKQKEKQYNCSNFVDILKKEDLYFTWYEKQNIKPSYRINPFILSYYYKSHSNNKNGEYNNIKAEDNQKYFDTFFAELENGIAKHIKSEKANINNLPIIQHCNIVERIPSEKTEFQAKLFNLYSKEHWNSEEFLACRLDFATEGGKLFKEELKDNWENSPSKDYINDLRKNIASHTSFALNSVHNLTLQSFAGFCQKGEEDISKLEDYLISNEIGDFRIAFALWGVVFGFANMPKTLTNDLFLSNDLNYVGEVYKYIYKQVHDIELDGKLEVKKLQEVFVTPSQLNGDKNKDESKATAIENNLYNEDSSLDLQNKLQSCKLDSNKLDSIKDVYDNNGKKINKILFDNIIKINGIGERKLERIKEALSYVENDIKSKKTNSKSQSEQTFRHYQSTGVFLSDFDFLSRYNDFIVVVSHQDKNWEKDLEWFIISHNKNHKDYEKYWKEKATDNESIIKQFISFKKDLYKSSEGILRKLYLADGQ